MLSGADQDPILALLAPSTPLYAPTKLPACVDAAGRRGGGKAQSLDGLSARRRLQILRRRARNRESMRRARERRKGADEQLPDEKTPDAVDATLLRLRETELQLLQERVSLRRRLTEFERSLQSIRIGLEDLRVDAESSDSPEFESTLMSLPHEDDYAWVDRILPLLPQLSATSDVFSLVRQSYAEVLAASNAAEKYLANANQGLGWRDARMVNGTWLDFVFRKEILRDNVNIIAARTWAVQSDGHHVNDVMPQKHKMRILRRINDSTLICARNLVFPGDPCNYCTIYLHLRVRNGRDGYVIAQRTLEPTDPQLLRQYLGPNYSYVSVFYGLTLSPRTWRGSDGDVLVESGCHVSFGGRVGNGTAKYASTWSMDILVAILRWEATCVGPILQLANTEADRQSDSSNKTK